MKFRGEYAFLSNFFQLPEPIKYDTKSFNTVEHAYQYAKCLLGSDRLAVFMAETPSKAKRIGSKVKKVPDWNSKKYSVMLELVRLKFSIPELRTRLLNIEGTIVEENHWNDTYWGVCNGVGQNNLGKILMTVRQECQLLGY